MVRFVKYEDAEQLALSGVGKEVLVRKFALTLRAVFSPPGEVEGPTKDLYFKILPKGKCSIPGGILGWPELDVTP